MPTNVLTTPSIIIVDDTPANLGLLDKLLRENGYRVYAFPRTDMALRAAEQRPPDLFLLDINMPNIDGYQTCKIIKANPELSGIPVIFISALNEPLDKVKAFQIGGVDYVNKPFQFEEVLARVQTHINIHRMQMQLADYNDYLEDRISAQVKEITDSQLATILALAKLAESRDDATGNHLERTQELSRYFAEYIHSLGVFTELQEPEYAQNLSFASALHDIGKVGIPDKVLLKPGKLTPEEFEVMKTHTVIGAETLQSVYEKYPNNSFIKIGIAIARSHHERWDGFGYPDGMFGYEIPLPARIMSVVDVYDALRSKRPYKEAYSHQKSREIIAESSGQQFDPILIRVFLELENEFERIYDFHSEIK